MGEYIVLECDDCSSPPTLCRGEQSLRFVCSCSESVTVPQIADQSVLDPYTGLWRDDESAFLVCQNCNTHCTLQRLEADGYYVRCNCENRSIAIDAIGDGPLFDPFEGKWADIDV